VKSFKLSCLAAAMVAAFAAPAFAGNGAPSGAHYNLNIIGVEKSKSADMTGSNRHSIFVALGKTGTVTSKIYLTPGDFKVCDGNAFDAATDCDGNQVAAQGAVFQLPCNTNLPDDQPGGLVACTVGETASYEVYARALGQPGGSATITTCTTDTQGTVDPTDDAVVCSTENVLLVRNKGKSTFTNVTKELTSLVGDLDGDTLNERIALFAGTTEDWFWQYDNNGLRLAQLRFYLLD